MLYYQEDSNSVISELNSTPNGLEKAEVERRQVEYGFNELQTEKKTNLFLLFITQFKSFIIYILLFAVVFSFILHEYIDATIILSILIANALIGFFQELSANKSLEALKKLNTIQAKVIREGKVEVINSKDLVPGDIIKLEAGDKVPADCRLIEQNRLKVEEAALTGESLPVSKITDKITKESQIADQTNMLFSSTTVLEGTAKAIVIETGMKTEIGKITSMIRDTQKELTPLQKKLDKFGKKLSYIIIIICIAVLVVMSIKNFLTVGLTPILFFEVFLIAVALAVAAVPEGLPAVVTITLSIGVKRLLKKKALVRRLASVETLGSCNVICTDKTGTLTKNEMTVQNAWTLDKEAQIEGIGYNPNGYVSSKLEPLLYKIGAVCNNSNLEKKENMWTITGDPTEAALLVSAKKTELEIKEIKRLDEFPFDSMRKMMSVLVEEKGKKFIYTKGAPDQLLKNCSFALKNGKKIKLSPKEKEIIGKKINEYSSEALRVLAFAYKESTSKDIEEKNLIFVGLQAMIDPPREDVSDSIAKTKRAGIRVIMITGDYKETALAIGRKIGIEGKALTGEEIGNLSLDELKKELKNNTNIFARVIPEHKQRIVGALQEQGHIVAMTGDGVNDAPALKKANIGVAVGSGTDVAKEAADFVLLDDSFTNIVNAIEEGRGIYQNIQKTIMLLLSGNLSEILIIFFAVLFGWNLPLTAIMLLWINLITDGAPALAMAVDPYSKDIMNQKPKDTKEEILSKQKLSVISLRGIILTIFALILFKLFGGASDIASEIQIGQSIVFLFVVISETLLVLIIRDYYKTPIFTNTWVWLAIGTSFVLQSLVMFTPLQTIFKVATLNFVQYMYFIGFEILLVLGSIVIKNLFPLYVKNKNLNYSTK